MTQTTDQKIAKLQADIDRLDKLTKVLVVHIERLQKENQKLKYSIGRTSRSLADTQGKVSKGLK